MNATATAILPSLKEGILNEGMRLRLAEEEREFLQVYRKAKQLSGADIMVAFHGGERVKLWLTEKYSF